MARSRRQSSSVIKMKNFLISFAFLSFQMPSKHTHFTPLSLASLNPVYIEILTASSDSPALLSVFLTPQQSVWKKFYGNVEEKTKYNYSHM